MDDQDPFAKVLVPALLAVPLEASEGDQTSQELLDFTHEARQLLRGWDYTTPAGDSDAAASAAYFNAVWRNLVTLLFDDELPVGLKSDGGARWRASVLTLLDDAESAWWDNKLTPNITEGKDEILRQSLVEARLELTRELGKDPGQWQWGKLHRLNLEHRVLGGESSPAAVRWLVNEGPVDLPGGSAIVNANAWNASQGYEVTAAPSMRMVVDLANLDGSTWINAPASAATPPTTATPTRWTTGPRAGSGRGRSPRMPCAPRTPTCSPCGPRAPPPAEAEVDQALGGQDRVDGPVVRFARQRGLVVADELTRVEQHDRRRPRRTARAPGRSSRPP